MDEVLSETPRIAQLLKAPNTSQSASGAAETISLATSKEIEQVESQDTWMVTEKYYLL